MGYDLYCFYWDMCKKNGGSFECNDIYISDSNRRPVSNRRPILKSASNSQIYGRFLLSQIDVQLRHWRILQMTSHPLGHSFETMMEKGQDQIRSTSTLADPNPNPNLTFTLTLTLTLILTLMITKWKVWVMRFDYYNIRGPPK
jgi:hypothetical protein